MDIYQEPHNMSSTKSRVHFDSTLFNIVMQFSSHSSLYRPQTTTMQRAVAFVEFLGITVQCFCLPGDVFAIAVERAWNTDMQ